MFGILSILSVFMMPTPGSIVNQDLAVTPAYLTTASCNSVNVDTSWIASLPRTEQFLANKLTRMELQSEALNSDTCNANQVGLAATGLNSAIEAGPAECSPQYHLENDPWISSQQGAEKRFILKDLRAECSVLSGGR